MADAPKTPQLEGQPRPTQAARAEQKADKALRAIDKIGGVASILVGRVEALEQAVEELRERAEAQPDIPQTIGQELTEIKAMLGALTAGQNDLRQLIMGEPEPEPYRQGEAKAAAREVLNLDDNMMAAAAARAGRP